MAGHRPTMLRNTEAMNTESPTRCLKVSLELKHDCEKVLASLAPIT